MGLVGASRATADAPDAEPTTAELAAQLTRAVEASIATRGKAARGGKTLLDALGPAADALHTGRPNPACRSPTRWPSPRRRLEAGAQAARDLEPTMGRQAWLSDRARGTVDAGALAVAIAFRAAADALAEDGL